MQMLSKKTGSMSSKNLIQRVVGLEHIRSLPLRELSGIYYLVTAIHPHSIPWISLYTSNNLIHNFSNTPLPIHSWNLLWHVWDQNHNLLATSSNWHPIPSTYKTPSSTFLNGTIGRPIVSICFSAGSMFFTSFHRSPGICHLWKVFLLFVNTNHK